MQKITWSDYSSYLSAKHLIAGFTNQDFQYSSSNDRVEFAKLLRLDSGKIVIPKQIHSNNVTICTEAGKIVDTDGIITKNKDLILSVQVADCIPIYLYDYRNQNIGLVHAGWRGVAYGIVENSIKKIKALDSNPFDIKILLGPSIKRCCFEIGPEVAKLFDKKFQEIGRGDRTRLDLQGVVINKLVNLNVQAENIIDINKCTCCSDQYHSFRKDGNLAGRMIAMIGWQKD